MNKHNETNAGFSWRTVDRAKKRGNWLRDLVIALAIALAVSILGMIGDAYAQGKSIQISGNNRTVMSEALGPDQGVDQEDQQDEGAESGEQVLDGHGSDPVSVRRPSLSSPRTYASMAAKKASVPAM